MTNEAAKAAAVEINRKWSAYPYDIEEFSERDSEIIQRHFDTATAELMEENKACGLAATAMWNFICMEMSWCDFRAVMLMDTASGKNSKMLRDFLENLEQSNPEVIGRIKKTASGGNV